MPVLTRMSLLLLAGITHVQAQFDFGGPCLLYGADFPAPKTPSKDAVVQAALTALKNNITAALAGKSTPYGILDSGNTSFSVDIYSTTETSSLFNYHHTASAHQKDLSGVKTVDSNTVYPIGSISKMVTDYLFLLEAGDTSWNEPVTKYIPELAAYAKAHPEAVYSNQIDYVNFNDITVGSVASELSGLVKDLTQDSWEAAGFRMKLPGLPAEDFDSVGLCGEDGYLNAACNRTQFFNVLLKEAPAVAPFSTAAYSNIGFTILAYCLEAITGQTLEQMFNSSIVARHGLNLTSFSVPKTTANSIIPISIASSFWNISLFENIPGGGYYSTINDMQKIGRAIINSTYLSQGQTRRWFQPRASDADPRGAIGAPWEMIAPPKAKNSTAFNWIFTKGGDVGTYNSLIGYMPNLNIGFTVLAAFSLGSPVTDVDSDTISNMIIAILYPALEAAAKAEANAAYAGTYHNQADNSSVVVATDIYSGLSITKWTVNGTDVRSYYLSLFAYPANFFMRLVPASLSNKNAAGQTTAVAFKMIASELLIDNDNILTNATYGVCVYWFEIDALLYGSLAIDTFVFQLNPSTGTAVSVEPRPFQQILPKTTY